MAFFQVTASELKAKAEELRSLNSHFKNEVGNLESTEGALKSKWVGQANETFHNAFMRDKGQMDNFNALIERYVEALLQIAQQYERAEASNTQIAGSRNY